MVKLVELVNLRIELRSKFLSSSSSRMTCFFEQTCKRIVLTTTMLIAVTCLQTNEAVGHNGSWVEKFFFDFSDFVDHEHRLDC